MAIFEKVRRSRRIRDHLGGDVADPVLTSLPHLICQVVERKKKIVDTREDVKRKINLRREPNIAIIEKEATEWINIIVIRKDIKISKKIESGITDHTQRRTKSLKIDVDTEK